MALMITGGTGFLGSYLAHHAARLLPSEDIVLYDRYPLAERIRDIASRVKLVTGDILDLDQIVAKMSEHRIDRVAHLASIPGSPRADSFVPYLNVQCIGTANVFEAARRNGIKRVVNASSVAVYGYGEGRGDDVAEGDLLNPREIYGSCKAWAENVARLYNDQHGMEILNLRICASMGYGRINRASLAAGLTTERLNWMAAPEIAAMGNAVTMPPDTQLFDFLHAADTAAAFWAALSVQNPKGRTFNVRAERRTAGEMTNLIRQILPNVEITISPTPIGQMPLMENNRLVAQLGFSPAFTLETGVREYVDRVRSHAKSTVA